jgi:MFS family permease
MSTLRFIRENARWLAAGGLLTLSSSFGQTYFIALSSGHIREEFGLSHAGWGAIYTIGTLASAVMLIYVGRLADTLRIRTLAAFVLVGFTFMCLAMASVVHWLMLIPVVFGLRFCGQGMMSHLALTAMGRWFRAQRGRAVSVASTGFAIGEGFLPFVFVALAVSIGWRHAWMLAALALLTVTLPLTLWLLKQERTPQSFAESHDSAGLGGRHWTRREALRHWLLWALLPGIVAPSFMITAVFFLQVHLAEIKGWPLAAYVALYPLYSLATVSSNLAAGIGIDRFGSLRLLPVYLLPLAGGLAVLGTAQTFWAAPLALCLIGISQGCSQAMIGALWPEYYGTRHLGAIRAMAVSTMVISSAVGPGLSGWLLDTGIGLEVQCLWMAAYLIAVSCLFLFISKAAERMRANSGIASD